MSKPAIAPVVKAGKVTHLYGIKLTQPLTVTPHLTVLAGHARSLVDIWTSVEESACDIFRILRESAGIGEKDVMFPEAVAGESSRSLVSRMESVFLEHAFPSPDLQGSPAQPQDPTNYKLDSGKLDYTLLMHDMAPAVRQVVNCLHWGHYTKGYPRNGYKTLPGGTDRLVAACYRHMAAMAEDFNALDEESGLPHAIHAVTNLLMALSQEKAQ